MSTNKAKKMEMASPNPTGDEDDDDVGALIYREVQLRKAEAAALRLRQLPKSRRHQLLQPIKELQPPVKKQNKELPLTSQQYIGDSKRRKREFSDASPGKKIARKRFVYECSADGCTNQVVRGGVCMRHGAKVKRCSSEGCPNYARLGGVCIRHGAKVKQCSSEGCTNQARNGGVCRRHGAKGKRCSREGCTNVAIKGGVCSVH
mmetsp:Transcript_22579/g.35418  ORF Transcript_22579/g.35418 Transcript_22579/m.35418 type:complete len:204 (-) Transcript_22579:81-692(-)